MGRPKSVILTPEQLKETLGANNARLKELRAQLKEQTAAKTEAERTAKKAIAEAVAARDGVIKTADKTIRGLTKEIEQLQAKNDKLKPPKA